MSLLNRTTRRVHVTADGAADYERVLLLADMDDAQTSLSDASAVPRGRSRVDVPSPLARLILMPALPTFHVRYPDIQLDRGVSDRRVDLIGENVDCVARGGTITDQSLIARCVGELQAGVYAAPSSLQRLGTPAHPQELENTQHRCVGFMRWSSSKTVPYVMQRGSEALDLQGRYGVASDDGNAYLAAGLAGMGGCGCRWTWPRRRWPVASWCNCSKTGQWSRCRYRSPSRPTGMSAPSCACLSIG